MPDLTPYARKYLPFLFKEQPQASRRQRPEKHPTDNLRPSLNLAYFLESNVSIFADIALTLKQEVFRRGMTWVPRFVVKCEICGCEYQEKRQTCECGSMLMREPDRRQIHLFKRMDGSGKTFMECANQNDQSLEEVLREKQRHIIVGDNGYLLCIKNYSYIMVGGIEKLVGAPIEFIALDPREITPIQQDNGLPGGKIWVCAVHRDKTAEKPGMCPVCSHEMQEAYYETAGMKGGKVYYLKDEIRHTSVYFPSVWGGSPPILRLIHEAYAYHYLTLRTYNYQRKGRPPGFIAFPTNNPESLSVQWDALLQKAQEDPDNPQVIGYDPGTGKGTAQFIKLMNDPGPEMLEVKKDLRERLGSMFGVSLIFQADTSASGGLNNEGLQITVTNRAVEDLQSPWNGRKENNYKEGEMYWIVSQFGITDFILQLAPSEEQDEMAEKLQFNQDAQNAKLMLDMGFDVSFENGNFTFSGQAQKPQPQPPGFGGFGGAGQPIAQTRQPEQPEPRVSGAPADVHKCSCGVKKNNDVDEFDELNKDELVKAYSRNVYQAIRRGALYYYYDGVSEQDVVTIHDIIKQAFADKRLSLREMVKKIIEETAVTEQQAEVIVRTETSSVANRAREIGWKKMEQERGEQFLYKWSVAHDHRTSDICMEIESRVGNGVPLDELKQIIKEVSQAYIPSWNGWEQLVAHPNERSTPVRIVL